jgi:hypothetical protein
MKNAVAANYLVSANKGARQISAVGEQFVQALPDREAAKQVMSSTKPSRKKNKKREEKT